MENAPYLIGRFLNLADSLHETWYKTVKEGYPLPPQLLGSSFFASFQQNPKQAFDSMGHRLLPYYTWARTNHVEDAKVAKRARWLWKEMGCIAEAIHKSGVPSQLTDTDKAEMLLGYLAFFGKSNAEESGIADSTALQPSNP